MISLAIVALAFTPFSTLVLFVLGLALVEVHRELFHPTLQLRHYLYELSGDYMRLIEALERKNPAAICSMVVLVPLLWFAFPLVAGGAGAIALVLTVYHLGLESRLTRLLEPVARQMVAKVTVALRPRLYCAKTALVIVIASSLGPALILADILIYPDLSGGAPRFDRYVAALIGTVLALAAGWAWVRSTASEEWRRLGGLIPILANLIFSTTILAACIDLARKVNLCWPLDRPKWNGFTAGFVLIAAGLRWQQVCATIVARNCWSGSLTAWSVFVLDFAWMSLWGTNISGLSNGFAAAVLIFEILCWLLVTKLLLRLARAGEPSCQLPVWLWLHLVTFICLMMALFSERFGQSLGLGLSLVLVFLLISRLVPMNLCERILRNTNGE